MIKSLYIEKQTSEEKKTCAIALREARKKTTTKN